MTISISGRNSFFQNGIFTTPERENGSGRNIFGERTVFTPPTAHLRETSRQRTDHISAEQESTTQPTRAQARLSGRSVSDIVTETPFDQSGGSILEISSGNLTFATETGETLSLEAGADARIFQTDRDLLTIQDRHSGEELKVSRGEELTVTGSGQGTLRGRQGSLEIQAGEQLRAIQTDAGRTGLQRPQTAARIGIGDESTLLTVRDESLTFLGDSGQNIGFEAGEQGSFVRGEDGVLTITHAESGESVTFQPGQDISVLGLGRGRLAGDNALEIEGPGTLQLSETEDETIEITNPETAQELTVDTLREAEEPQRPLQLEIFSDPRLERMQTLQSELIQRPLEEQREQQREERESESEESEEIAPASFAEDNGAAAVEPASFLEENSAVSPASFSEEIDETAAESPLTPASFREDNGEDNGVIPGSFAEENGEITIESEENGSAEEELATEEISEFTLEDENNNSQADLIRETIAAANLETSEEQEVNIYA